MVVVCEATLAAVGLDWGTGGVHFVTAIVYQGSLSKEAVNGGGGFGENPHEISRSGIIKDATGRADFNVGQGV